MKRSFTHIFFAMLVLALTLALAACAAPSPAATTASTAVATNMYPSAEAALPVATTAASQPTSAASGGSCLSGTWKLSDISGFILSLQNALTSRGANLTIGDVSLTGTASLTFNPDSTVQMSADNFKESFNISMQVDSNTMNIPVELAMQGASQANYAVSGDTITFTGHQNGTMQQTLTVMGSTTDLTGDLLGTSSDTSTSFAYSCMDANTLHLTVTSVNLGTDPVILTRVN